MFEVNSSRILEIRETCKAEIRFVRKVYPIYLKYDTKIIFSAFI